jgi:hypothetical protein
MIVSKTSLINTAAQSILDAEKLEKPESVTKALTVTGEMLYGNVAEIDEADQIEILGRIRNAVTDGMAESAPGKLIDDARLSEMMGTFAGAFVSASESMGLADIDYGALRLSVVNALCANHV